MWPQIQLNLSNDQHHDPSHSPVFDVLKIEKSSCHTANQNTASNSCSFSANHKRGSNGQWKHSFNNCASRPIKSEVLTHACICLFWYENIILKLYLWSSWTINVISFIFYLHSYKYKLVFYLWQHLMMRCHKHECISWLLLVTSNTSDPILKTLIF